MIRYTAGSLPLALLLLLPMSCQTQKETGWQARTLYEMDSKIQCIVHGPIGEGGRPHLALVSADGRCVLLWREGEQWLSRVVHQAPGGLSAVALGDADPELPGLELLLGGSTGQVWLLALRREGDILARVIHESDAPVNDLAVYDLNGSSPGHEILVLTEDGKATVIWQSGVLGDRTLRSRIVLEDTERLRNALAGPYGIQDQPAALVVGASGHLTRIHAVGDSWRAVSLFRNPDSLARLAAGDVDPVSPAAEIVLCDDAGRITLLRKGPGEYLAEEVHHEKKALRGVAVAELDATAAGEEIAVFGYGKEVALFARTATGFKRKVLFTDTDRGHWLTAAQILPESPTHELVSVGYSGKVTLLSWE